MNRITKETLRQILIDGENDTIEFKRVIPSQFYMVERMISAFANTRGGSVIYGYDEQNRDVVGVGYDQIRRLQNIINSEKYGSICNVYAIEIEGKLIAVMDVQKSKVTMYVKGVAYTRNGSGTFSKVGNIRSKHLKIFVDEIQYRNRNPRNTQVLKLLDAVDTNPERILLPGTHLYRSRVIYDMTKAGKEPGFYGYGAKDSFVPPASVTRDLRANYRYIPYLYCANNPYTAMVEVRPRLGANVSIATVTVKEKLTLLDFTLNSIPKRMAEPKQNLFADLSMLFSKPVTSDDDILDYIPTQYIAEYAKFLGYDGIAFRSSLTPEIDDQDDKYNEEIDRYNVVVFNYNKCIPTSSNVVNVTRNYLACKQIDDDPNKIDVHASVLSM